MCFDKFNVGGTFSRRGDWGEGVIVSNVSLSDMPADSVLCTRRCCYSTLTSVQFTQVHDSRSGEGRGSLYLTTTLPCRVHRSSTDSRRGEGGGSL